jgi:hypothetical protein
MPENVKILMTTKKTHLNFYDLVYHAAFVAEKKKSIKIKSQRIRARVLAQFRLKSINCFACCYLV